MQNNELEKNNYKYLYGINSPKDLKKIPLNELPKVCDEVRNFMIDTVTQTGGHFGSGLGVVELTVALHYVYNTPIDKIIFDTGHQGYPHKILTGRRDSFHTIRQKDGLSGFLKPNESEYDAFGAGHASTSISAGLGIATARDLMKEDYKVISVIGDGAMTGGMAYEAMNNCGVQKRDITVILNDNNVSIDANVSALSDYFNDIFVSSTAQKIRSNIWELTGKMDELGDRLRKVANRLEGGIKAVITPGMLFEALGFKYYGPIDGHNVQKLVRMLRIIKGIKTPILFHVVTHKGKGYKPAEEDPHYFHAIGKIDKDTGKSITKSSDNKSPQYYKVFGNALTEIMQTNPKVVAITAAMAEGTGLDIVQEVFPKRVFDVGIAEAHGITFAAGMAQQGIIPVCAIYSSFLQRAYDQIAHDCVLQNLHVIFAIDRAGLVGSDGSTHHGILDIVFLRTLQNIVVMAPKDEQELRNMLYSAVFYYKNSPVAIRFPRGKGLGMPPTPMQYIPLGQSETLIDGDDVAIIAYGKMVNEALKAAILLLDDNIHAEVINARFAKPLDTDMLDDVCLRFDKVITLEDGIINGGFGSAILEYINTLPHKKPDILIHGIPNEIIEHGTQEELFHDLQLDAEGIANITKNFLFDKSKLVSESLLKDKFKIM